MIDILTPVSGILETERTYLKQIRITDATSFYNLIQKNKKRLQDSFPVTLDNTINETTTELFIQSRFSEWEERISFAFGLWAKDSGELIGYVSVKNIDWVIPRAEIAYFISSDYEGKGIMKEALQGTIKFCFEELKIIRLFLRIMTDNKRSNILAEKCGFIKEGMFRKDHRTFDGNLKDLNYFGMTYEDYEKFSASKLKTQ